MRPHEFLWVDESELNEAMRIAARWQRLIVEIATTVNDRPHLVRHIRTPRRKSLKRLRGRVLPCRCVGRQLRWFFGYRFPFWMQFVCLTS